MKKSYEIIAIFKYGNGQEFEEKYVIKTKTREEAEKIVRKKCSKIISEQENPNWDDCFTLISYYILT